MERLSINVVENATKTVNIMPETPLDKVVADCMKDYLEMRKAEEQGLLLRLHLAEGTQVHCIGSCGEICDDYDTDCEVCGEHKVVFTTSFDRNMIEQFGKTVFASEEEAEQALKQMGE